MTNKLEERKKRIDDQIEKNLLRKKMLVAQEKRKRASKFSDIGKIAYNANIDQLQDDELLGAFLEIAKNISNAKLVEWKEQANEFKNHRSKLMDQVFCISFLEEPTIEVKKQLKENKFTWNRFRKEYYGKGNQSEINEILENSKVKIEIIDN
jgi:hypothetical protein